MARGTGALLLLAVLGALLTLGCAERRSAPTVAGSRPTLVRAASTPAYAGPHPDIVGSWQVLDFEEQQGDVYTCLENDTTIDFHADGSWQAVSRMAPHTYGGTYLFTAADRLTLLTGITQYYQVSLDGDMVLLDSGQSLHAVLRRMPATATPGP